MVGNKTKGQISKQRKAKHTTFSEKRIFLTPDMHWCPPWCQPPTQIFLHPTSKSHLDKKHHLSPFLYLFLEQKSLFLDLMIPLIKPLKTSDFSKHVSHVMTWWYYRRKHSQTYYNKVYHIHRSLCTIYIRVNPVKRNSQTCIT